MCWLPTILRQSNQCSERVIIYLLLLKKMDSQETTLQQEISTTVEQPVEVELELDWEVVKLPLDEIKKGYLRQSDYTRKTQMLAEERKRLDELKQKQEPDEVVQAREFLKQENVVTKDDLENFYKQQQYEIWFNDLLKVSPELKKHEEAIRALQRSTGWAYEDVIVKYGFSSSDKVAKAKEARYSLEGMNPKLQDKKSIKDMTPEEYAKFRKEKGIRDKY